MGTTQGEFSGVEPRLGTLLLYRAGKATNGDLCVYKTDREGNATKRSEVIPNYDPRTRPWYTAAVKASKPVWSNIYVDVTSKAIAVTAAQPIYDARGKLLGVLGSDFVFVQVNKFLQSLKIGKTGSAFIIERSGDLVTTSTQAPVQRGNEDNPERIKATESENELIR